MFFGEGSREQDWKFLFSGGVELSWFGQAKE